jgi:hypothetical protein
LKDGIGTGLYFCGYEVLKRALSGIENQITQHTSSNAETDPASLRKRNTWIYALSGGLTGSLSWIFLFPIDSVKSVIQRQGLYELGLGNHMRSKPTTTHANLSPPSHSTEIKTHLTEQVIHKNPKYKSATSYILSTLSKKGISRFYIGITPQLIRSFPVHALNFIVYEYVLMWCGCAGI